MGDRSPAAVYRLLGGTSEQPALRCLGWDAEGDTVALRYRVDGLADLTETLVFPGRDLAAAAERPATAGALDVLLLTAASSYFKTVVPGRLVAPGLTPAARRMVAALLDDGLGEFAAVNGLAWPPDVQLQAPVMAAAAPTARPAGALVPVGGGKDSAVAAAVAARGEVPVTAFSVNPRDSMRRTAGALGIELVTATRRLPERLFELNRAGALNGHVPVTAIVASIAAVAATLTGRGEVLLANEASADEPTRLVDGRPVNHQFSKSSTFEVLLAAALDEATGGAVRVLSVLRPLPELLVAAAFVHLGLDLAAVNSCNRAYPLRGEVREWCGDCPKCRFVQVMLAPFVDPSAFRSATGFDALADEAQLTAFDDLRHPDRKPYECVGTVEEVQLALDLLADDPAWRGHAVVAALGRPGQDANRRLAALAAGVDASALPAPYDELVATLASELASELAA